MRAFISVADVIRITGEPRHVVTYALSRFGPEPAGRIGITRVWLREDLPQIQEALRKTSKRSLSRREPASA